MPNLDVTPTGDHRRFPSETQKSVSNFYSDVIIKVGTQPVISSFLFLQVIAISLTNNVIEKNQCCVNTLGLSAFLL
jgi:hypothetical protein